MDFFSDFVHSDDWNDSKQWEKGKKVLLFSVKISDCKVETFCAGGKGGQHQNATKSAVRVTHPPSGAVGECREERYQLVNKRRAFRRMAESDAFKRWARLQAAGGAYRVRLDVDELMKPENLKIEVRDEQGRWVPWTEGLEGLRV